MPPLPTARRSPSGALRRAPRRFHIERLEDRHLMDGGGAVQNDPPLDLDSIVHMAEEHVSGISATVTLQTDQAVNVPRFSHPGELEQFLIDQAIRRFGGQFGQTYHRYPNGSPSIWPYDPNGFQLFATDAAVLSTISNNTHSETNTQEEGVDEADIVETDGQFLYTFSDGKLVIADLSNLESPEIASTTALEGRFTEMYLQGDRLTLIDRGSYRDGQKVATVLVLDVADRSDPAIVERTEIEGRIVATRAVGDRVYVAAVGFDLPPPESHLLEGAGTEKYEVWVNETLDEYVSRVRTVIVGQALPTYRTYDGSGEMVGSGPQTSADHIHKPVDVADGSFLSLVTFDAGDDVAGPLSSTGVFTDTAAEVYMSGNSIYVLRNGVGKTAIFKFQVAESGATELVASGEVDGFLLNQFSVDEHDGRLRIATTVSQTGNGWLRQRFNNLYVLEQQGTSLNVVGSVENLAPTETIKSVRFIDSRAYVVTFRVVDPLFAIDLSDPANPTVESELKIPGYSDYLHPVGENYLIGIGRDADEVTGALGAPQVSLFYVGDLSNLTLVDKFTLDDATWASSEAWNDHRAVAYFAEDRVLAIPVHWTDRSDDENGGYVYSDHSAMWTFQIDTNGAGEGSITSTGRVLHDGNVRRSVRIGDSLITVSEHDVKINNLHDPEEQIAELYVGSLPDAVDDEFTIDPNAPPIRLEVLANDVGVERASPNSIGVRLISAVWPVVGVPFTPILAIDFPTNVIAITDAINFQPVERSTLTITQVGPTSHGGTVEIDPTGQGLTYSPAAGFVGVDTFTYTVTALDGRTDTASVSISVGVAPPSETGLKAGPAKSGFAGLETFAMRENGKGMLAENEIRVFPALVTRRRVTPVGRTSGTERFEQFENAYPSRAEAPLRRATERRPGSASPRLVDLAISEFEKHEMNELDDELAGVLATSLEYFRD